MIPKPILSGGAQAVGSRLPTGSDPATAGYGAIALQGYRASITATSRSSLTVRRSHDEEIQVEQTLPQNICIIDDDEDFGQFLSHYMESRGIRSSLFLSAEDFMDKAKVEDYDFYILDLGLPGLDGVDLAALIRARTDAGILVISGRMGPDAFNSALAAGADMFINKPVRFDQVHYAITTICRRTAKKHVLQNDWRLTADGGTLHSPANAAVALSQLEAKLIQCLCAAGGAPVSRADLVEAASMHGGSDHRNLDAAIFRLRRKIEKETGLPSPFKTVHGVGYQLAAPILTAAG